MNTALADWWERESKAALARLRNHISRCAGQHMRHLRAAHAVAAARYQPATPTKEKP